MERGNKNNSGVVQRLNALQPPPCERTVSRGGVSMSETTQLHFGTLFLHFRTEGSSSVQAWLSSAQSGHIVSPLQSVLPPDGVLLCLGFLMVGFFAKGPVDTVETRMPCLSATAPGADLQCLRFKCTFLWNTYFCAACWDREQDQECS